MSADLPAREAQATVRAVRVQAVFRVADDQQAQAVAAKMIDRAHEIANLPEYECDVDVGVELTRPDSSVGPPDPNGAPARGRTTKL